MEALFYFLSAHELNGQEKKEGGDILDIMFMWLRDTCGCTGEGGSKE